MAESNDPHVPSAADPAPLGLAAGRPELPRVSASVEQLLELQRIGTMMTPDRERPEEAWGVLNPASARSRDGELYLFPRVVADGNYSRIAIARVSFDTAGNPAGVERLDIVLEPRESYELAGPRVGGVEDPRISYLPLLDSYVMTYTALGPHGARIAIAISKDLRSWDRLGLLHFEATDGMDLNRCDNKDCVIFPVPVRDPAGRPAFALLHRPTYLVPRPDGTTEWHTPPVITDRRPSIWISYVPVDRVEQDIRALTHLSDHQLLAQPIGTWEHHHIGSGAPPILSEEGWLLYYHGVLSAAPAGPHATPGGLVYQSGVMLLDRDNPRRVLYRSSKPVLLPQEPGEQEGIVSNVVFPTAVDVRGQRIDVYYGAADERIAAATTRISASVLLAPSAPPGADALHRVVVPGARAGGRHGHRAEGGVPRAGGVSRDGLEGQEGETGTHVKDLMTRSVEVVSPDTTLDDVATGAENPKLAGETLGHAASRSDRMRGRYERILVALDGSSLAERVLASVEPLAQRFGSRVILLRVVTPVHAPIVAEVAPGAMGVDRPAAGAAPITNGATSREAAGYLIAVQQRLAAQGLTVESECPEGLASEIILRRARQLGVDLIALTTHGRTGVDRLLLGSVAEDVVRRAPCPVHLVRVHSGR